MKRKPAQYRVLKSEKLLRIVAILLLFFQTAVNPAPVDIILQKQIEESKKFTLQAKEELNHHKFDTSLKLIQKAIKLDPSNEEAKRIYVNIRSFLKNTEPMISTNKNKRENRPSNDIHPDLKSAQVDNKKPLPEENSQSRKYFQVGLLYMKGTSNYITILDSSVEQTGGRLEAGYFITHDNYQIGLSSDYSWLPIKIKGDPNIDIVIHKANIFLCGQKSFWGVDHQPLVLGIRTGYHFYLLQNRKNLGVYYYTQVAGPAFGIYFSDPLFFRFWTTVIGKRFTIECGIMCVPLYKKTDSSIAFEYNINPTYRISNLDFSVGWRSYHVDNGEIHERFAGIEVNMRFHF